MIKEMSLIDKQKNPNINRDYGEKAHFSESDLQGLCTAYACSKCKLIALLEEKVKGLEE